MNANAAALPPVRASSSRAGTLETLVWLVRRELWEHRALWIAPLVVEGLLAVALLLGRHIQIGTDEPFPSGVFPRHVRVAFFTIAEWVQAQPVLLVSAVTLSFYLLDALYAERKDRSILFWKSLPVSDELTVASKLLVATVVVPLGTLALAIVAGLVFAAIAALRVPGALAWDSVEWLRAVLLLLIEVVLAVLWYAPIAGALLLLSAWVRRAPILWASLVPLVAPILEYVAFGTTHISNFERYRINGIWHKLGEGQEHLFSRLQDIHPIGDVLGSLHLGAAFTDVDLWMGVVAGLLMAYAAARIRRFRES